MLCCTCLEAAARIGQKTCAACHAEYMRGWRKKSAQSKLEKAYRRGFEALRADLMKHFARIGRGEMNGYTAAEIVKNSLPDVPRATIPR